MIVTVLLSTFVRAPRIVNTTYFFRLGEGESLNASQVYFSLLQRLMIIKIFTSKRSVTLGFWHFNGKPCHSALYFEL